MATELGSESTAEKGPHAYLSSKAHRKPSEGQTGPRRSGRPLTGSSPQSFLPQCAPPRPCPSPSGILSEPAPSASSGRPSNRLGVQPWALSQWSDHLDMIHRTWSESLSWNRAWGRGSPRVTGEGGQRPWSAAGAGRTRAAQGGCRLLSGYNIPFFSL